MVVQEDGTVRRIANWDEMSAGERESVNRVLTKRNQERLANWEAKSAEPPKSRSHDAAQHGGMINGKSWVNMEKEEKQKLISGLSPESKVCTYVCVCSRLQE